MRHGIGLNKILGTIHIYPTMAEANKYAAGAWKTRARAAARAARSSSVSTHGCAASTCSRSLLAAPPAAAFDQPTRRGTRSSSGTSSC